MQLKKIAGISFALSFLFAINLFAGVGRQYVSVNTAKICFLIFGAIAILFNLFSFQTNKKHIAFNLFYWFGTLIAFTGLVFQQFNLPYSKYILLIGGLVLGISFLIPEKITEKESDDDLIDNL